MPRRYSSILPLLSYLRCNKADDENNSMPNIVLFGWGWPNICPIWMGFGSLCMPNTCPIWMGLAKHLSYLDGVWLIVSSSTLIMSIERMLVLQCSATDTMSLSFPAGGRKHCQELLMNNASEAKGHPSTSQLWKRSSCLRLQVPSRRRSPRLPMTAPCRPHRRRRVRR
jgi:hypothetical protein